MKVSKCSFSNLTLKNLQQDQAVLNLNLSFSAEEFYSEHYLEQLIKDHSRSVG